MSLYDEISPLLIVRGTYEASDESDTISDDEKTVIMCQMCDAEDRHMDVCYHCDRALCSRCQEKHNYYYIVCDECGILTCYKSDTCEPRCTSGCPSCSIK